jgi:hypothetical protein
MLLLASINAGWQGGGQGGGRGTDDTSTPTPTPTPQTCEEKCWCEGNKLVCQREDCSTDEQECKYGCSNGQCLSDTQAPITYASIDPSKWYPSPVQVTLNCYDSESGCKHTYYCIDTENICEPDMKGSSVRIECAKGSVCKYYLRFYSVDNAGNKEPVKSIKVQIDNAKPETAYSG